VAADRHRGDHRQYLSLGAAGVQLGTRFVAAEECIAHPRFRRRSCGPRPGRHVRRSSTGAAHDPGASDHQRGYEGLQPLQLDLLYKVKAGRCLGEEARSSSRSSGSGRAARRGRGGRDTVAHGGQSVAFVKKIQPVREILDDLVTGREAALARMAGRVMFRIIPRTRSSSFSSRRRRRTSSRGERLKDLLEDFDDVRERVRAIEEVEHKGDPSPTRSSGS